MNSQCFSAELSLLFDQSGLQVVCAQACKKTECDPLEDCSHVSCRIHSTPLPHDCSVAIVEEWLVTSVSAKYSVKLKHILNTYRNHCYHYTFPCCGTLIALIGHSRLKLVDRTPMRRMSVSGFTRGNHQMPLFGFRHVQGSGVSAPTD